MKLHKSYIELLPFIFTIVLFGCQNSDKTISDTESLLVDYLNENWESPESYIIKKFENHDYVIIGEAHRVKHDVELVVRLIPQLYKNGIYNLAMEFGAYPFQPLVDSLLNLPHFDRNLARTIMFRSEAGWAFKEYIAIYEAAWKVNSTLQNNDIKFRVINLAPPYDPCKEDSEMFGGHDYDKYMARNVINELVSNNKKALVYAGFHHSFTKYQQPYYDFEQNKFGGLNKTRMGNILCDTLKNRTFNIFLHYPWVSDQGWDKNNVSPVNGVIDSIMGLFSKKSIGFDVYNSPFGDLPASDTYYAFGYPGFSLKMFCDGYIFQKHYEDYENMTIEKDFINQDNIHDFISFMKCSGKIDEELDSLNNDKINELLYSDIREKIKHLM